MPEIQLSDLDSLSKSRMQKNQSASQKEQVAHQQKQVANQQKQVAQRQNEISQQYRSLSASLKEKESQSRKLADVHLQRGTRAIAQTNDIVRNSNASQESIKKWETISKNCHSSECVKELDKLANNMYQNGEINDKQYKLIQEELNKARINFKKYYHFDMLSRNISENLQQIQQLQIKQITEEQLKMLQMKSSLYSNLYYWLTKDLDNDVDLEESIDEKKEENIDEELEKKKEEDYNQLLRSISNVDLVNYTPQTEYGKELFINTVRKPVRAVVPLAI